MNHPEVAHAWAHDSYGRRGELNGSRMFARQHDRTIYSYGTHFPIARKTDIPGFPVLFTNRGYSLSTARHISLVRCAVSHLPLFYCHNPADSIASILSTEWQELNANTIPAVANTRRSIESMKARIAARAAKRQPESATLAQRLADLEQSEAAQLASIAERMSDLERLRIAALQSVPVAG